jgi:plastocyanin
MRSTTAVLASLVILALAAPSAPAADVTIFVGGGTPVSNGTFFPGTQLYDGTSYSGVAYEVQKGSNINLVNLDESTVANGHRLVSFRRNKRTGLPLFQSALLESPGESDVVVISNLRKGLYRYYCSTHDGMFGAVQIVD